MSIVKMKQKAQMEIIGLVVIVILISLALLFALQFSLKPKQEEKASYTHAQLASNTINTLLKTKAECFPTFTISELLKEYVKESDAAQEKFECANKTIADILNKTLVAWQKSFRFKITMPAGKQSINITSGICQKQIEASPPYIISSNGEYIVARLEICG